MSEPGKPNSGDSTGNSNSPVTPSQFHHTRPTEILDPTQLRDLPLSIYMEPEFDDRVILIDPEDAENLMRTMNPEYIPKEYFEATPPKTAEGKSRSSSADGVSENPSTITVPAEELVAALISLDINHDQLIPKSVADEDKEAEEAVPGKLPPIQEKITEGVESASATTPTTGN